MFDRVARLRRRLRAVTDRSRLEREMDEEIRYHLESEAADLVRAGVAPEEARRRARVAFGGVERFKEAGRDARGVRWLDDLSQDVRYGLRQLHRSPGFTVASAVTIALGAGRRKLLRLVVGDGMRLVAVGSVIGLAGAFALTRLMGFLLYGIGPTDPATLIGVILTLGAIAVGASFVPARRAAKVDPLTSLRAE